MDHTPKQWTYRSPEPGPVSEIMKDMSLSRPAATVLVNRGFTSAKKARGFLYPNVADLGNPFLLPDMERAVGRIREALAKKEKILVYGDRDTDGITSISVMVRTLKSLGSDPLWYIPSDEGYGVHREIIDRYAALGVKLIITVDCGISALEETVYAREKGIDTVVTDHHEPNAAGLPSAVAVVDPKRTDSRYPFSELAGCSVSLKVSEALMLSFGKHYNEELSAVAVNGAAGAFELGAVRTKNGIVLDTFSAAFPADEGCLGRLAAFLGDTKIMSYQSEPSLELLGRLFEERLGRGFDNRVLDGAGLFLHHFVDKGPDDIPALAGVEPPESGLALDRALFCARIFQRLEQMTDIRMNFFRDNHLDAVTLGTIADIMPLVSENRILVKQGLKYLPQSRSVGIQALLEECAGRQKGGDCTAKTVSWSIAPLLNAAGRRGRADLAAELLLTDDEHRAWKLLAEISKLNAERKELQAENLEKFLPLLKEQCDLEKDKLFLVTASGVEHGVTGIIASQIMRTYQRPTILLIIEGNEAMGAARSVPGVDLVSLLSKAGDLMIKYGGHSQAAGLTVAADRIGEFRSRIKEIADREISPDLLIPVLEIDSDIESSEINLALLKELAELEPYGMGNPLPVFSVKNVKVMESSTVGARGDHLKLRVARNGSSALSAIGWGMGYLHKDMQSCPLVDLAVQLELNVWNDRKSVQLLIVDLKPSVC